MTAQLLSLIGGLLTGLVTGWIFERRASSSTRRQNADLRSELSVLRSTMLSLGGDPEPSYVKHEVVDLVGAVTSRAIETQDPSGRVHRGALVAHFLGCGHDVSDVDRAIHRLCETGSARELGTWLQIP